MSFIPVVAEFLQVLLTHPLLAYFTVIGLFFADTIVSGFINFGGVFGACMTVILNLLGVPIEVTSAQLLVLVVITPIIFIIIDKSK